MPTAAAITKLLPWTRIANAVALTGTLVQKGVAFSVASFSSAAVDIAYTVGGGSATGSPVIAIDLSRSSSAVDPAAITDWVPLYILDGSTFVAGLIPGYTERFAPVSPTGAGTSFATRWPDTIDVSCHFWLRVRALDVDAALPGTVTIYCGGSV